MENDPRLNLIGSIILLAVSVASLTGSVLIYLRTTEPLHTSPALLPGLIAVALVLCSGLLMWQAIKGAGLKERLAESGAWLRSLARHQDLTRVLIGLAMMALYTFVLVQYLQFWAASFLFLLALLLYLRTIRWYWACVIAATTVGGIVLLFAGVFNMPLP